MLDSNQDYIDIIKKVGEYNLKDTYLWRDKAEFFWNRANPQTNPDQC